MFNYFFDRYSLIVVILYINLEFMCFGRVDISYCSVEEI